MGNKSRISERELSGGIIPPKGKKSLGLGFDFEKAKKLANDFSLTIFHESNPPGAVSFTNLKTK